MAPRTATKPAGRTRKAQAEPEADGTRDYTVYADKVPSVTMATFAEWLLDETGIEFKTVKEEEAFNKGVALGGTLRMDFQRSDFWREHDDNPRNKADEPKARPTRGRKATPKAVEPDDEDEIEDEPETKPARRTGRRPAAASKSAAKAPARRGRKAVAKPADDDEDVDAPF